MSRQSPAAALKTTLPEGQTLNRADYQPNLPNAFKPVGGAKRELEILHLQRRVIVTFTYLRMLQHLVARGVITEDTPISVTGMSMQIGSAGDGKQAAHQVMGELHAGGQPLYGYWGDDGITTTERQALAFLTAATSDIDLEFNKIDILIERNGRLAYGDLACQVARQGSAMSPELLWDAVAKIFVDACAASLAAIPTSKNVFHRRKKGVDENALLAQLEEDTAQAEEMLETYGKRLANFGVVGKAFASRSLDSLMAEIKAKAYPTV